MWVIERWCGRGEWATAPPIPIQYQGYTYYQSNYPQEQNEPNGQQEAGAQPPDLDPFDLAALAYGAGSIVRGIAEAGPSRVDMAKGLFTSGEAAVQTLNIGRFVTGQAIKIVVQTAQGPLEITAEVETQGSKVILKNLDVVPQSGLGTTKTTPGPGALKAVFDVLKNELRKDGFTEVSYKALNWGRAPVGPVSGTFKLQ